MQIVMDTQAIVKQMGLDPQAYTEWSKNESKLLAETSKSTASSLVIGAIKYWRLDTSR